MISSTDLMSTCSVLLVKKVVNTCVLLNIVANMILLNYAGFVSLRGAVITPIVTIALAIHRAWASFRKKKVDYLKLGISTFIALIVLCSGELGGGGGAPSPLGRR
jgi:O-antigen/teichoic acid export membrane protein